MTQTPPQDSVSDVERLRAIVHNDAILFGQIEQRMRECWIGTGKLCDDGSASNDFRVWMNEAHNRQRDLKAALDQNPNLPLVALAVPINKIGEDARTYDDGVEDAIGIVQSAADQWLRFRQGGGVTLGAEFFDEEACDQFHRTAISMIPAIRRLSTCTDKGVSNAR